MEKKLIMFKGTANPLPQFSKKCFKDSSQAALTAIIFLIKSAHMASYSAKYAVTYLATSSI
jgi:hypothetical protein